MSGKSFDSILFWQHCARINAQNREFINLDWDMKEYGALFGIVWNGISPMTMFTHGLAARSVITHDYLDKLINAALAY